MSGAFNTCKPAASVAVVLVSSALVRNMTEGAGCDALVVGKVASGVVCDVKYQVLIVLRDGRLFPLSCCRECTRMLRLNFSFFCSPR